MKPQPPASPAPARRPLLLVVSAPSGAGKSTLCERLRAEFPALRYSVSCTTRPPRGREADGRAYHFLSEEEFERRARAGEFLEHARVHGHRYGTLRRAVADALRAGDDVLMDIDVQGAAQVRDMARRSAPGDPLREGFVDIFIEPPDLDTLRARLVARGEDAPDEIARRMEQARRELERRGEYRHRIVNDRLDEAQSRLRAVYLDRS
jgi:guanylate kinase